MKFTSFYWLGREVQRAVIEAPTVAAAWAEHDLGGWSCYDDRRLVRGDVATEDADRHAAIEIVGAP